MTSGMSRLFIVIVTGPPGAGKTTLGSRLSGVVAAICQLGADNAYRRLLNRGFVALLAYLSRVGSVDPTPRA